MGIMRPVSMSTRTNWNAANAPVVVGVGGGERGGKVGPRGGAGRWGCLQGRGRGWKPLGVVVGGRFHGNHATSVHANTHKLECGECTCRGGGGGEGQGDRQGGATGRGEAVGGGGKWSRIGVGNTAKVGGGARQGARDKETRTISNSPQPAFTFPSRRPPHSPTLPPHLRPC